MVSKTPIEDALDLPDAAIGAGAGAPLLAVAPGATANEGRALVKLEGREGGNEPGNGAPAAGAAAGAALEGGGAGRLGGGGNAGADAGADTAATPEGGTLGNLMVGEAVGLGGNVMRTVSFFGWTLASAGLGGTAPLGVFGKLSAIY